MLAPNLAPPPPLRFDQPLAIALRNTAGHAELNLPEAPQPLALALENQSPAEIELPPGATFQLQFRPGTLRGMQHIGLSPAAGAAWRIEVNAGQHSLRLEVHQPIRLAPGEATTIQLQGVAADPEGGTRSSRVRVDYCGLLSQDRELGGHQLLHLAVRRAKVSAPSADAIVGSGTSAIAGPFTAGFTTGAAVLNGGQALNDLQLAIVNTSGRPLRLSADDDQTTRLVLDYAVGSESVPWGLLRLHGDHFDVAEPEGGCWRREGTTLRCIEAGVWAAGQVVELTLTLHTSALPGQAQLRLGIENLPEHDDLQLALTVDIGPLAAYAERTATLRPIELWGPEARLDFVAMDFKGGAEPAGRVSLQADGARALRLAAQWLRVVDNEVLPTTPRPAEAALELRVHQRVAWVQSRGGAPLHLNPEGGPVAVGNGSPPLADTALTVGGTLRLTAAASSGHDPAAVVGAAPAAAAELHLGVHADHAWLQSDKQMPMKINPLGNPVGIGLGVVPVPNSSLTVKGPLAIRGEPQDGTADLYLGADANHQWINSPTNKPLQINISGAPVQIGAQAQTSAKAALTVGKGLIVIDDLRNPFMPGNSLVLRTTVDGQPQLHFGVYEVGPWLQSIGGPLTINPIGSGVCIGAAAVLDPFHALTVCGPLRIGATAAQNPMNRGLLELRQFDSAFNWSGLDIHVQSHGVWVQSGPAGTPLYLNPAGELVIIDVDRLRLRFGSQLLRFTNVVVKEEHLFSTDSHSELRLVPAPAGETQ